VTEDFKSPVRLKPATLFEKEGFKQRREQATRPTLGTTKKATERYKKGPPMAAQTL